MKKSSSFGGEGDLLPKTKKKKNRYVAIIETIFAERYAAGAREVSFSRIDIERVAKRLRIKLPKNLGDVLYTFRHRAELPTSIQAKAPPGRFWLILPAGRAKYVFTAMTMDKFAAHSDVAAVKIPNATPAIISKYALADEQAVLARIRYNRLLDIFTGVTCYSLQNHLRTTVPVMGQVETDEVYVGLDKRGVHYVFPVQAKGAKDKIGAVQIYQDIAMCADKFPDLVCRPIAAQLISENEVALLEFVRDEGEVKISREAHYRLVPADEVTAEDLARYRSATLE